LHDPVKQAFGDEYNKHFAKIGFAQRMGFAGTTQRLKKWLSALAVTINTGNAPSQVVALTLHFLEAPRITANLHRCQETEDDCRTASHPWQYV